MKVVLKRPSRGKTALTRLILFISEGKLTPVDVSSPERRGRCSGVFCLVQPLEMDRVPGGRHPRSAENLEAIGPGRGREPILLVLLGLPLPYPPLLTSLSYLVLDNNRY
jgi:hypothetical protein